MGYEIKTEIFEGPLDLMLHLIRENKLDIFDLDMSILCDEYLTYLNKMEDLKLEIESEYLVELAILVEYKSKKLLPNKVENIDGKYEEDPRDTLVKRLLEYQKYKEVSKDLNEAFEERSYQLAKPISDTKDIELSNEEKYEGNILDLYKAMNRLLRRIQLAKPIETKYTQKEISIDVRILIIKSRLKDLDDIFIFETLIDDCHDIQEAVVTFLAVLDLIKENILDFTIDQNDNIYLKRSDVC